MGTVTAVRRRPPDAPPRVERGVEHGVERGVEPGRGGRPVEPLWRELVGRQLRRERQARRLRLVDVAEAAGVSTQYLSEIERGRKDPSSEVLAAVAGALGVSVTTIARRVCEPAGHARPTGPVCLAA